MDASHFWCWLVGVIVGGMFGAFGAMLRIARLQEPEEKGGIQLSTPKLWSHYLAMEKELRRRGYYTAESDHDD